MPLWNLLDILLTFSFPPSQSFVLDNGMGSSDMNGHSHGNIGPGTNKGQGRVVGSNNQRSGDYLRNNMSVAYYPSHADATYDAKYGACIGLQGASSHCIHLHYHHHVSFSFLPVRPSL